MEDFNALLGRENLSQLRGQFGMNGRKVSPGVQIWPLEFQQKGFELNK